MLPVPAEPWGRWLVAWLRCGIRVEYTHLGSFAPVRDLLHVGREGWSFLALLAGDMEITLAGRRLRLRPGEIVAIPPRVGFTRDVSAARARTFEMGLHVVPTLGGPDPLLMLGALPRARLDVARLRRSAEAIAELGERAPVDLASALALRPRAEDLLREWLLELLAQRAPPAGPPAPPWLAALFREAVVQLRGSDASVVALAQRAGCSASHLAHLWKRHFGGGVLATVRAERLANAARRLASDPEARVLQVARAWGWPTTASFDRAFRRRFGCSPERWRGRRRSRAAGGTS